MRFSWRRHGTRDAGPGDQVPRLVSRVFLALTLLATHLVAQAPRELGVEALSLIRDSSLVGGAVYGALRIAPRTRLALTGGLGGGPGGLGGRAELAGHFLLNPLDQRGWGIYGGGGLALEQRGATRGFVELVLGAESDPGARHGWVVEAGLGGGVRLALGWRTRWFPRRAPPS